MLASEEARCGATGRQDGADADKPPTIVGDETAAGRGALVLRSTAADSLAMMLRRSNGALLASAAAVACHGCSRGGGGDPSGIKLADDGEPTGATEGRRLPGIAGDEPGGEMTTGRVEAVEESSRKSSSRANGSSTSRTAGSDGLEFGDMLGRRRGDLPDSGVGASCGDAPGERRAEGEGRGELGTMAGR